jgi:ABC-2 type transport system permease protein
MRRFLVVARLNALMVLRNPAAVFWSIAFPALMMAFWGYLAQRLAAQSGGGGRAFAGALGPDTPYAGFLMAGTLLLTAMSTGILGYGASMAHLRERGVLRRVRCTPLPAWQFFGGRMSAQVAINAISAVVVVLIATGLFGVRLSWQTLPFGAVVVLLAITLFAAIGQLVASVSRTADTAQVVAQAVTFPLMWVSGLFIPLEVFPKAIQSVAQWLPGAVAANLARPALIEGTLGPQAVLQLLVLCGYIVVTVGLAARLFRWD